MLTCWRRCWRTRKLATLLRASKHFACPSVLTIADADWPGPTHTHTRAHTTERNRLNWQQHTRNAVTRAQHTAQLVGGRNSGGGPTGGSLTTHTHPQCVGWVVGWVGGLLLCLCVCASIHGLFWGSDCDGPRVFECKISETNCCSRLVWCVCVVAKPENNSSSTVAH